MCDGGDAEEDTPQDDDFNPDVDLADWEGFDDDGDEEEDEEV